MICVATEETLRKLFTVYISFFGQVVHVVRWRDIWREGEDEKLFRNHHMIPRSGHCRVSFVKVGKERRKLWLKLMGPKPWKLCIS